jgi:hypothetical protein
LDNKKIDNDPFVNAFDDYVGEWEILDENMDPYDEMLYELASKYSHDIFCEIVPVYFAFGGYSNGNVFVEEDIVEFLCGKLRDYSDKIE